MDNIEEFLRNEVIPRIDKYWEEQLDGVQYLLNVPFMKGKNGDREFEQWLNNLT